jgi:hypothetical protein
MSRYIEIVYDNSGSMGEQLHNRCKYEIALQLLKEEVLPLIALPGDTVVLRLLRKDCNANGSTAYSLTANYGVDRIKMFDHISRVKYDQSTPLFLTVKDALETAKSVIADEYQIFILTDGDDTCTKPFGDIIRAEEAEYYKQFFNILLVQFVIQSAISKNNLAALVSHVGGQTVNLDGNDPLPVMKTKLKRSLELSKFVNEFPLEYCFDNLPGMALNWREIKTLHADVHQARILYNAGALSWEPAENLRLTPLMVAELKFLYDIHFKNGIPLPIMLSMLAQLKKPYYYSHNCIYWDFSAARWRHFNRQNVIFSQNNPDAEGADFPATKNPHYIKPKENFDWHRVYEVTPVENTTEPMFNLVENRYKLPPDKVVHLKTGDFVDFNLQ